MKTFEEWLNEMAIAVPGDWVPQKSIIGTLTETGVRIYYHLLETVTIAKHEYEIRAHKSGGVIVLGVWGKTNRKTKLGPANENIFIELGKIRYSKTSSLKHLYTRPIQIHAVEVDDTRRVGGFATAMYKAICDNGATIIGDEKQYFGARKLWTRLSKELNLQVDIIDVNENVVVEEDVILHHGQYDEDFDERVWSYENNKANLRLALRKVL